MSETNTGIAIPAVLDLIEQTRTAFNRAMVSRSGEQEFREAVQTVAELVLSVWQVPSMHVADSLFIDPLLNEIRIERHNRSYWLYPEVPAERPPLECLQIFLKTARDILQQ